MRQPLSVHCTCTKCEKATLHQLIEERPLWVIYACIWCKTQRIFNLMNK